MKKLVLLLSVLVLAACDRPTSVAELSCNLDKHWQSVDILFLQNFYSDNEYSDTDINIKVATYENYAKVTFDNITTVFEKVLEDKSYGEFGRVSITYKGNFPGSERTAVLDVLGDITNKKILEYQIKFIGEKFADNGIITRFCTPVKDNEYGGAVSFNHNYKMPNKTERCINEIVQKVYCVSSDENGNCNRLSILYNNKMLYLTQKDALSISPNWNYANMNLYQNDGKLEKHELDACDALDRLNKFIHETGLDSEKNEDYITLQREIANCDECGRIIATGDDGDFLIRLPKTDALNHFSFLEKNAKFLSVSNPNQYAKSGYCLVNIIPYNTMEKLGWQNKTCSYRIYCGAPESMDYDQYYAVAVCE